MITLLNRHLQVYKRVSFFLQFKFNYNKFQVPQQVGGNDCGVFTCFFVKCIIDAAIASSFIPESIVGAALTDRLFSSNIPDISVYRKTIQQTLMALWDCCDKLPDSPLSHPDTPDDDDDVLISEATVTSTLPDVMAETTVDKSAPVEPVVADMSDLVAIGTASRSADKITKGSIWLANSKDYLIE